MLAAPIRIVLAASLAAPFVIPTPVRAATHAVAYASRVMDLNHLGLTVTNYGFVGNNFVSRSASMEYPLGSGFEHLIRGGVWIGAVAQDESGVFTGVSTAAIDGSVGSSPVPGTEFTPDGSDVIRRSSIFSSPHYSPDAKSHLDAIGLYSDLPAKSGSRPLSVGVRQENLSWVTPGHEDFIISRYVVRNLGTTPLTNLWVGLYTELASGPKNEYASWPPSSFGSPLGSWYRKALLEYDASLRMIREHRCAGLPAPGACQFEVTPYWAGVKLLTAPEPGQSVTLAAWNYAPGSALRDEDSERYAILSAGTIQDLSAPDLQPLTGDPVELLGIGPFGPIAPGDSITVDFALVGGAEVSDIQSHAAAAQALYDGVVPALVSLAEAQTMAGIARVVWHSETLERATVLRRERNAVWERRGEVRADGSGRLIFNDRDVLPGHRYGYALRSDDAPGVMLGEVWLDIPPADGFALDGARQGAGVERSIEVAFTLDREATGDLAVLDIAGRVRDRVGLAGLSAGSHTIKLGPSLPPGIYFVRLAHGGRVANAKVVSAR